MATRPTIQSARRLLRHDNKAANITFDASDTLETNKGAPCPPGSGPATTNVYCTPNTTCGGGVPQDAPANSLPPDAPQDVLQDDPKQGLLTVKAYCNHMEAGGTDPNLTGRGRILLSRNLAGRFDKLHVPTPGASISEVRDQSDPPASLELEDDDHLLTTDSHREQLSCNAQPPDLHLKDHLPTVEECRDQMSTLSTVSCPEGRGCSDGRP